MADTKLILTCVLFIASSGIIAQDHSDIKADNNHPSHPAQDPNYDQQLQTPISSASNYDDMDDYNNNNNQVLGSGRVTSASYQNSKRFLGPDIESRSDNRNNRFDDAFRPKLSKCDRRIRVLNGATRIRDKGALVRFQCSYGFHLLGVSVAVCVRGQWSDPAPVCVKDGCKKLTIPLQGSLRQLYGGGVAIFNCNYGFELEGLRILTCDGQRWNGTAPVCTEIPPITIAPPSTTFPSLPELITTEEASLDPMLFAPSSSNASATEPDTANAPPNPRIDDNDQDYVLVPSSNNTSIITFETTSASISEDNSDFLDKKTADSHLAIIETTEPDVSFPTLAPTVIPALTTTISPPVIDVAPAPTFAPTLTTSSTTFIPTPIPFTITTTKPSTTATAVKTFTIPSTISTTTSTAEPTTSIRTNPTTTLHTTSVPVPTATTTKPSTTYTPKWPTKPTMTTTANTTSTKQTAPADQEPLPYNPILPTTAATPTISKLEIKAPESGNSFGNILVVVGVILIALGSVIMAGGVVTYCWRKNIGIARPRSQDVDGRTLNMSEGSTEEFMWAENRDDSGL